MALTAAGERVNWEEMSRVTPDKIVSAVEQIVAKAKPLQVIAFGSRARGDHKRYSDLDLAVIMERYDVKLNAWPVSRTEINARFSMDLLFSIGNATSS